MKFSYIFASTSAFFLFAMSATEAKLGSTLSKTDNNTATMADPFDAMDEEEERYLQVGNGPKNPACITGTFKPDPSKYYIIRNQVSDGGKMWAHKFYKPTPDSLGNFILGDLPRSQEDKELAHWRFIEKSDGKYDVVNRQTGQVKYNFAPPSCNPNSSFVNIGNPGLVVGRERQESGCKKATRNCAEIFGFDSGFLTFISKRKSNCVGAKRFTCEKLLVDTKTTKWVIHEVQQFQKLEGPGLTRPTVNLANPSALTASEGIAVAGVLGASIVAQGFGCPVCGGIFGTSLALGNQLFGGSGGNGQLEDALNQLTNEILDATQEMIDTSTAEENVRFFVNDLNGRRNFFNGRYLNDKHEFFGNYDLEAIADLRIQLEGVWFEYDNTITTIFGNDFTPSKTNTVRAFVGFDFLTFALMESLAVLQEAMVLQSFNFPEESCDSISTRMVLREKAAEYKARLIDTQKLLIKQRAKDCCETEKTTFRAECASPSNCRTPTPLFEFTEKEKLVFQIRDTRADGEVLKILQARRHDILNLSYPIFSYLKYFDNYFDFSVAMCEAVRDDPTVRTRFITDDISVPVTCGLENDLCLGAVDCCSRTCSDGVCLGE